MGQIVSALMLVWYLRRFKTGRLERRHFKVSWERTKRICAIGAAASFNQAAMVVMNTVRNNVLRKYGALSVYGASEALAASGVVHKVNHLFYSTIVGCGVGASPIMSFNFGAKKYGRVLEAYRLILRYALIVGALETACFWLFPDAILRLFGSGAAGYRDFAVRFMHEFMLLVVIAGVPTVSMHVMTAVGKAKRGILISLSKQFALIVLMLSLPLAFGIDGALWAGPTADVLAAAASFLVLRPEFRALREMAERLEPGQG
jgi:Na+-driven multidrug efflux pump